MIDFGKGEKSGEELSIIVGPRPPKIKPEKDILF